MTDNLAAIIYFVFGAAGTAGRVVVTPSLTFGANRRTIVEILSGGAAGAVLAWLGPILVKSAGFPELAGTMPIMVKGFAIFVLAASGSLVVDKILLRFVGMTPSPPEGKP